VTAFSLAGLLAFRRDNLAQLEDTLAAAWSADRDDIVPARIPYVTIYAPQRQSVGNPE
jgi:hypothetical protein